MAHLLDSSRDMAYVGAKPWHGLGTLLQPGADLDQWRVAANLDWTAEKRQAYYSTVDAAGKRIPTPVKDHFALVRDDTQACLGTVSDRYKIVQPAEVLEFYRDLTADAGFTMETAGCLAGGQRIWALAKTGAATRIKGQDEVQGYLLLATSYDGKMATIAKFTSVRVVCQNTLSMSLADGSDTISIGHHTTFNAASVKQKLGLADDTWHQFERDVNHLAEVRVDESDCVEFLKQVLGPDKALKVNAAGRAAFSNTSKKLISLMAGGKGQEYRSANGTYWGLVNAVTEYYDHHSKSRSAENRLNSAWFGNGAAVKAKAFAVAKEMAAAA